MDAIELLKQDHHSMDELFEDFETAVNVSEKRSIFEELRAILEKHTQLEETLFYPKFLEINEFRELIEEAFEDHAEFKDIMLELEALSDDAEFENTLDELIDCVQHHIEQEETEIFPALQRTQSPLLSEIGVQIEAEKRRSEAA